MTTPTRPTAVRRSSLVILTTVFAIACDPPSGPEAGSRLGDDGEVIFFVQGAPATVVMDALFDGVVSRDAAGCLRLAGPDPATVVWPFGFRLVLGRVSDGEGRGIGRLGERFRFGGGEVRFLPDGLGLSDSERRLVEAWCPGRYWIVGEVLEQ